MRRMVLLEPDGSNAGDKVVWVERELCSARGWSDRTSYLPTLTSRNSVRPINLSWICLTDPIES